MKKTTLPVILAFLLLSCNSGEKSSSTVSGNLKKLIEKGPVTLDLDNKTPAQDILLQEVADVSYIPLETTDDVLLAQFKYVAAITDSLVLIRNGFYEFVTFNSDGTILSQFNKRGESRQEYTSAAIHSYDKQAKEFYIVDGAAQRIQVYSLDGKYNRTIPFQSANQVSFLAKIGEPLLMYENYESYTEMNKDTVLQPYIVYSEKEENLSRLDITITDPVSTKVRTGEFITLSPNRSILAYGDGFLLFNNSIDTVHYFTQEREIKPIIAIEPTIKQTNSILDMYFVCDSYLFLEQTMKTPRPGKTGKDSEALAFDFKTGDLFPYKFVNQDFPTQKDINLFWRPQAPKNVLTSLIEAGDILDAYDEGKLSGTLKELAPTLDADDNPVLMIVKFHEN